MELNKTGDMAKKVVEELKKHMKTKIENIRIEDVVEDRNHRLFSIRFQAYNYFLIFIHYDRGRIGYNIQYGENTFVGLKNSQKWYEKVDFDIFCKELQEDLELRIPNKFLEAYS